MKYLPILMAVLFFSVVGSAQDTQKNQKDLQEVEKKIKQKKKDLINIERRQKNVLGSLHKIDKKRDELKQVANKTKKEIKLQNAIIQKTQNEIKNMQSKLARQKGFMRAHFQHLYKHGSMNVLQTWFQKMEANDRRKQNVWIAHWVEKEKEKVQGYRAVVKDLELKNAALVDQKQKKEDLLGEVKVHESQLAQEKEKKQVLLASIKNQKSLYQQSLDELEQASQKIQKLINQFNYAPSVDAGVFEKARGTLLSPVPGKIVRRYGSYNDKTLKAKVHHKGVDYQASMGDEVKSVFDGKVMYTGWFEGYGKVVIVDHGSHYYSLYAHLSATSVTMHQQVSKGTVLGEVGDTGSLKGAYLYFELRKKGVTINPLPWFG